MKKILSLSLAALMLFSMVPTAMAADYTEGTKVEYTANTNESWTVTVPASLTPGNAGDVTASGTWGSNRKLVVTADDSVKLTNSINSADYKDLAVTFADINLVGDNTQAVSETKPVSVAAMPDDALFGTWSGTFYYDVEMVDNVISFVIEAWEEVFVPYEFEVKAGTTWGEFCDSLDGDTNTIGLGYNDDGTMTLWGGMGALVYDRELDYNVDGNWVKASDVIENTTYYER